MSTPPAVADGNYNGKRMIGISLALLGWIYCLVNLYVTRHKFDMGLDFRAVYGSTRCIIAGCHPYYFADMRAQFLQHGGSIAEALTQKRGPFVPFYVGYPPPTLFYLVPFALLPWPLAWYVFMGIAIALYTIAIVLFADLGSEYVPIAASLCLGYFLAVEHDIVMLGQPTLMAAALLCIALWCLLKNRHVWLAVLTFACSLILKPHLGGLFLLYFLVATPSYRKRALQIIGLTAALCMPAILWFNTHASTRNWVQEYKTNLAGISAPGNLSDPGPKNIAENRIIDLQTIVSRYRDEPAFYNHVVWAFSAILIGVWLYPVIRRRRSQEKDILCIAAIAAFSMIPIYHRTYDSRALLILFPALAVLMRRTVWWSRVATFVTVVASFTLAEYYGKYTRPANHIVTFLANHLALQTMVVHVVPLILLGITIFYLAVLYLSPPSLALDAENVPGRLEEAFD